VEPKKPTGAQLNLDDAEEEKPQKTVKNAVSAIQRIGGGGAAYSNGDPMLREQQRQTRELTTQTGLLRDVKRAIENKPTASTTTLSPVGNDRRGDPQGRLRAVTFIRGTTGHGPRRVFSLVRGCGGAG
jgi:hypothetical protein